MSGFSPRRVWVILRKDLLDAIRDARVLMAVILPLGIGLFYSFAFEDTEPTPTATVAYTQGTGDTLIQTLSQLVSPVVDIEFKPMSNEEVRQHVAETKADLGLILTDGFDADVAAGNDPHVIAVIPEDRTFGGDYVLSALDPALRLMAGQELPATIEVETQTKDLDALSLFDRLGIRTYLVLVSLMLTITMIGVMAIPIVLAEESEKKTIDALALVSGFAEIVSAKALLGMIYLGMATTILTMLTAIKPNNWLLYVATVLMLGLAIIGFGLLIAGFLPNASQLNTWSSLFMIPFIAPVFLVETGVSEIVDRIAGFFPTGAGMRLLIDSTTDVGNIQSPWPELVTIVIWTVIAYVLLIWQLKRRRS